MAGAWQLNVYGGVWSDRGVIIWRYVFAFLLSFSSYPPFKTLVGEDSWWFAEPEFFSSKY
jgi:hypothetical protein